MGCPVRILQGGKDPDVPWRHAFALAHRLPADDVVLTARNRLHRTFPTGNNTLDRAAGLFLGASAHSCIVVQNEYRENHLGMLHLAATSPAIARDGGDCNMKSVGFEQELALSMRNVLAVLSVCPVYLNSLS